MNYSEALSFTFEDADWVKKVVVGGLIAFVSLYCGLFFITGFLILGYYMVLLRNVIRGEEHPLPDWSDFGKIFVDGVMGGIIFAIYFVIIGLLAALPIAQVASDPFIQEVQKGVTITIISLVGLFIFALLVNAGFIQFAITENFGAAFNLTRIQHLLKNNLANFLSILIFSAILNGLLFFAGLGIVSPFTNFWGMLVQAHLFGQCAREVYQLDTSVVQST